MINFLFSWFSIPIEKTQNKNSQTETNLHYIFFNFSSIVQNTELRSNNKKKKTKTTTRKKHKKFRDYTQYNLTLRLLNSLCLTVSSRFEHYDASNNWIFILKNKRITIYKRKRDNCWIWCGVGTERSSTFTWMLNRWFIAYMCVMRCRLHRYVCCFAWPNTHYTHRCCDDMCGWGVEQLVVK